MKNLFILLITVIVITSCKKDDEIIINQEDTKQEDTKQEDPKQEEPVTDEEFAMANFGNPIITNFIGRAVDETGKQLKDVQITIGNKTVITDHNGVFVLNDASVYEKFAYVKANKEGFIAGSRTLVPTSMGNNDIQITLLKKNIVGTISSGESSEVSMPNGSAVSFGGDFVDDSGNPYSGQVEVSMHYLEPNKGTTFLQMPGMLFGQREDGSVSAMETYGMLAVNLFSPSGEELNISEDSLATLSFPISTTTLNKETEIPLWYFDEVTGYWKEQGIAIKEGNKYIAKVSHFTWWNCDYPLGAIKGCIRLLEANDKVLSNYYLEVIRSNNQKIFTGYVNNEGEECGYFPKDEEFVIKVYDKCSKDNPDVIYEKKVGPFVSETNIDITVPLAGDAIITKLKATLNDCNNNPITKGYVAIFQDEADFNSNNIIVVNIIDGQLDHDIVGCEGVNYKMLITDFNSIKQSDVIDIELKPTTTNLGIVSVCITPPERIYPRSITLHTQEQVERFGLLGYTEIHGYLDIKPNNNDPDVIKDLFFLNSIQVVQGDLKILLDNSLTSLSGLDNINTIGGDLVVQQNESLTSISSLNKLTTVKGDLIIAYNRALKNLSGFENLETIEGDLNIWNNTLESISSFNKLITIGGNLSISGSNSLRTFLGFNNLVSVGQDLSITSHNSLINLSGINSLVAVGGDLIIRDNKALQNISSLVKLTTVGGDIKIYEDMDSLTSISGLDGLNAIGGSLFLRANKSLKGISGLNNLTSLGGSIDITSCPALSSISGINNITKTNGLFISFNDSLKNISGLNNLTTIGDWGFGGGTGSLQITYNKSLTSLSGLKKTTEMGANLKINNNDLLETLSGLDSFNRIKGRITIEKNPVLVDYCALTNLFLNGSYNTTQYEAIKIAGISIQDIKDGNCIKN